MLNQRLPLRPDIDGVDQRGINMVDLMMWLVIAALLLAAALQGIGFYQRAAWNYQLKNDMASVRTFMEAQKYNKGTYPNHGELAASVTSGELKLTGANTVDGASLDAQDNWAVRICSQEMKKATGNATGSAMRINRYDTKQLDLAVCN